VTLVRVQLLSHGRAISEWSPKAQIGCRRRYGVVSPASIR
jgi:hypothetical protein